MNQKKTLKKYIYERDSKACRFCNKKLLFRQISLDHYLPKSKKGPDDVFNIVLSCKKCNKLKQNRVPDDFESVLLENFKKGVEDKRIISSVDKLKYDVLKEITDNLEKIEQIDKTSVFQGKKYRVYVKKNIVNKIVGLGNTENQHR